MISGNICFETDYSTLKNLSYNAATVTENQLSAYIQSGHNASCMTIGNYFEPNPMPFDVDTVKNTFNLKSTSVAINRLLPGHYLPIHSDHYERWMKVNKYDQIDNIFRAIVMLNDHETGQMLQIGDIIHTNWKTGDWFSWTGSTPHAIYNMSQSTRYAIQVTGYQGD